MEIIPLIYLRKRKIVGKKEGEWLSLNELTKQVEKDSIIYVLDIDGIEKNKDGTEKKYKIWDTLNMIFPMSIQHKIMQ